MGDLAAVLHIQPSEIKGMDAAEMKFWHEQALRVAKRSAAP